VTRDEKIACLKQMLHEVSPSGAGADMLDSVVAPGSASDNSESAPLESPGPDPYHGPEHNPRW